VVFPQRATFFLGSFLAVTSGTLQARLPAAVPAVDTAIGGDPGRLVVEATRIPDAMAIRIDGALDEEAWRLANPIADFRQREPVEGGVPSERTELRILYDARALYIGGMFYDADPEGILAHQLARDASEETDDRFVWILDTFGNRRTGYFFETNPAGIMRDGLITGASGSAGLNMRWDGIWEVRTRIEPNGWSAEIRIPFATLNFDPALGTWGVDFQRTIRRRNEEILWSGWRRHETLLRPVHAGELRGLADMSQGMGMEVKPYVLTSGRHAAAAGMPWEGSLKGGLDITRSLTPSLRAGLSINTDFAEVEVDERRVNLTRFPQRFPELREFFLEGSGVFSFRWADPFFSRRIGLVEGQEVPIRYGARLGGQIGGYELGLYQVRTGSALLQRSDGANPLQPAEDFTVGRVKRSLFQGSHVGAIYTRRASNASASEVDRSDRHTIGADIDLYTSRAFGRYNAGIEGFLVYHTDPAGVEALVSPERRARGFRWSFSGDLIRHHVSYRDFGDAWDPAVGFAQRRGFRRYQPTLRIAPRPGWRLVRQTEHGIHFEYLTDTDHRLLTRNLNVTLLEANFESGDRVSLEAGREFERLERIFTIHGRGEDAIRIQPGDYDASKWSMELQTAGRRTVSGRAALRRAGFWGGDRTQLELSATLRPRRGVVLSADYERNVVGLPQGDFTTNLGRWSWGWNLSPLASITGSLQYDDVTRGIVLFARARWIVRPGTDVFLVWSHDWQDDRLSDGRFTTASSGGALKANYSYRF
jgi:hypothetical protein